MAGELPEYIDHVRRHRLCCAPDDGRCMGPVEAHHAGRRGLSQRAHDDTAIPLCTQHHRDYHQAAGPFRAMDRDQRRAWVEARIEETRATYHPAQFPDWF